MKLLTLTVFITLIAGCEPQVRHYVVHPDGTAADIVDSWDRPDVSSAIERAFERATERAERRRQHLRAQI
jgi:pyrroline-5-carboxylate reductase